MALKVHKGSCHCKSVHYEVEADLEKGTYRCNCSYCSKVRNWGHMTKPNAFRWTQGFDFVTDYRMTPEGSHYFFCKKCGTRISTVGFIEEIGGDFLSFTVSTLDTILPEELEKLPIQPMDGLNNDWFNVPKFHKYL